MVSNDVDIDIEPIFSTVLLAPSVGTLALSTNGNFTYTPPANYTGTVTWMYQGCDPCGACDQGFVTMYITPPNQPPVANDDDTFTSEDGSVSGSVASNDTDPENMLGLGLGFLAVILGTLNVVGGFVVTDRMLEMFKKK